MAERVLVVPLPSVSIEFYMMNLVSATLWGLKGANLREQTERMITVL